MTHSNSRDAVRSLRAQTSWATERQQDLARLAGHNLPRRLPRLVAAARLRTWFAEDLALQSSTEIPGWLVEALQDIEHQTDRTPTSTPENRDVAESWLQHLRLQMRIERLVDMPLRHDDIVQRRDNAADLFLVSSITDDGAIWFQGGRGARAWPDQIEVVIPTDAAHEHELRNRAQARTAALRPPSFSTADAADLQEFRTKRVTHRDKIEGLRTVIDAAKDEAPVQAFLTKYPELLALLVRGSTPYVRPQVRLGSQYVADFIIGDVDSNGPRWVLIELETPRSTVALKSKDQFEQHTRDGIAQVNQWRHWLRENLHYARKRRRDDGCGLPGIQPEADGIVIVGRWHLQNHNAAKLKIQQSEHDRIRIHTYDWLVEQIEGSLGNIDSPVFNKHILPRPENPDDDLFI